jgi:hypothetical protein
MYRTERYIGSLVIATAMIATLASIGCSASGRVRINNATAREHQAPVPANGNQSSDNATRVAEGHQK